MTNDNIIFQNDNITKMQRAVSVDRALSMKNKLLTDTYYIRHIEATEIREMKQCVSGHHYKGTCWFLCPDAIHHTLLAVVCGKTR